MADTIKTVFERDCAGLNVGSVLAKRLHDYQVGFVNKNDDHIAFFGGNLLGVQTVRFTSDDRNRWFDEILEMPEDTLEEHLLALPGVNADWNVSSDTMNLSCAWLAHALYTSKLADKAKHEAMVDVMLVLQYKFLTSRLYRLFRYPADKAVAEATYAQLSYKFAIKQYGSWSALFRARAEEIIAQHSIHFQTISKMDNDPGVIYLLNDTQGRIRDMLKNIYGLFREVHEKGTRISTTSQMVEHDGESILKDKSKALPGYIRYLNSVISDQHSFIRAELVAVIEKLMFTMPPRLFRQTLEFMSENYRQPRAKEIEAVLQEVLLHAYDYLSQNRTLVRNERDLPGILSKLRGVYMSSRSTDPALFSLREKTETIVHQATESRNESTIASVRTGVLLYLVARTFSMHHYQQA